MVVHRTAGMAFGLTTTLNHAKTLGLKFKLMCTSKTKQTTKKNPKTKKTKNEISLYFNELIKTCQ